MAKKEEKQINNLEDLCEFFGVESPEDLNRSIYKNTACGASISLYSGHPGRYETQSWDFRIVRRHAGTSTEKICVGVRRPDRKSRNYLPLSHSCVPKEFQEYFYLKEGRRDSMDLEALDMSWEELIGSDHHDCQVWRRWGPIPHGETIGNSRYGTLTLRCRVGYVPGQAWHNGEDWSDIVPEEITGFTIQSIVEGSEVTVDSPLYVFPVTAAEIDEWMEYMDGATSYYWKRDNSESYRLDHNGETVAYIQVTWGETSWYEAEDVPQEMKEKVEKLLQDPPANFQNEYLTIDIEDAWVLEEYCDDSEY